MAPPLRHATTWSQNASKVLDVHRGHFHVKSIFLVCCIPKLESRLNADKCRPKAGRGAPANDEPDCGNQCATHVCVLISLMSNFY